MADWIKLQAADGHEFQGYVAEPQGTPRAALIVVQEAFGVNHHIRAVADRLAVEGYLALAPALYDRYQRGFEAGYEGEEFGRGIAIAQGLHPDWTMADMLAAVVYARDEYKTKVGVVGFCLGGSVAWMAAAQLPIAASVGYYGGMIAKAKDASLKAPVLLHFGEKDDHIPVSDVEAIRAAHPEIPVYLYPAGHAFSNDDRGSYDEPSARQAWGRTLSFLAEHLGGRIDNLPA